MKIRDFPKLHSPFIRKMIDNRYLVTPEIDPNYKWIFDDGVIAVDKLDGTNICVRIKNSRIHRVFNRTHEKLIFNVGQTSLEGFIMEGIAHTIQRGWMNLEDGDYFGELIGKRINTNRHQLKDYLFVPFNYLKDKCHWHSWAHNKYPKNFEAISEWFKDLPSLFNKRMKKLPDIQTEGLIFYHPNGYRICKLRRNMFDWYNKK